jgi:hypothetical protein
MVATAHRGCALICAPGGWRVSKKSVERRWLVKGWSAARSSATATGSGPVGARVWLPSADQMPLSRSPVLDESGIRRPTGHPRSLTSAGVGGLLADIAVDCSHARKAVIVGGSRSLDVAGRNVLVQ